MKQTIEIEVPDGKKAVWKDGRVIFEDIKPQLPKTWEKFCAQNNKKIGECYWDSYCGLIEVSGGSTRNKVIDRNMLPNKQAALAHLALIQLHRLRDCYRQGWEPDWKNIYNKYVIVKNRNKYAVLVATLGSRFLAFQDRERAEEFLTNFRELIEQAGDLI